MQPSKWHFRSLAQFLEMPKCFHPYDPVGTFSAHEWNPILKHERVNKWHINSRLRAESHVNGHIFVHEKSCFIAVTFVNEICGALEHNVTVVNLFLVSNNHFFLARSLSFSLTHMRHSIAIHFKMERNGRKKNAFSGIFWQSENICHWIETSNLPHATTN